MKANYPSTDIRYDLYDHFPIWQERKDGKKNVNIVKHHKHNVFVPNVIFIYVVLQPKIVFMTITTNNYILENIFPKNKYKKII